MYPVIELGFAKVPTYLLILSLTYSVLLFWTVRRAKNRELDIGITLDLCLAIMAGGFIGARALHIIYEAPQHYLNSPDQIFKFWNGGFVFFGGLLGAAAASWFVFHRAKTDANPYLDLFAPILAIGYAFGRLGCLAAGCCFGAHTEWSWGITFPHGVEAPSGVTLHPTQIIAFSWELALAFFLIISESKFKKRLFPGSLFFIWLSGHAIGRILMELFRGDPRGEKILSLSLSTWISVFLLLYAVSWLLRNYASSRLEVSEQKD